MKVRSVMTAEVEACGPADKLSDAAAIMWRRDCGIIPVLDDERRVLGVVTDRDICMAVAMRGRLASEISVGEVATAQPRSCNPADDVRDALDTMAREQLRRLPVVNADGTLAGILSLSDVLRRSARGKGKRHVSHRDAMAAAKAIARPRDPDGEEAAPPDEPAQDDAPAASEDPPVEGNS
jgi:CBS domain-containing protein